jgi:Ion channel
MHVRTLWAQLQSGDSYALVLGLLLAALFVAIAAPEETWARVLRDSVFVATVVIAYWTATARRAFLIPRVVVPSLGLALVVVAIAEGATTEATGATIAAVLAAGAIFLVARDLFDRGRVDVQTILGTLSLYVLIGFLFAWAFTLVAEIGDGPFFSRGDDGTPAEQLYFSFVTISTTGYGDLSPAGGVGRALAVLEIVIGQLYLVTVVAVIVTAATGRRLIGRDRAG